MGWRIVEPRNVCLRYFSGAIWLAAVGCLSEGATSVPIVGQSQALFANGGFETDVIGIAPAAWTLTANLNPGVTLQNPQTLAGLNLEVGGQPASVVVGGAAESQSDPDVPAVSFPKFGTRSVCINRTGLVSGANRNVNSLTRQTTVSMADVDPDDGKIHVRFVIAPVLQSAPEYSASEQPYYFIEVRNVTQSNVLYQDFVVGNQAGVPWQSTGAGNLYTDWQLVDVSGEESSLLLGDTVAIQVLAAGSSQNTHWGRLYVDAFGPAPPGLFASATAPDSANAGTDLTYLVRYKNAGAAPTSATTLALVTPLGTTFKSVSSAGQCTTPAVGTGGTITCNLGMLAAGGGGTATLSVAIAVGTTNPIMQGNYAVHASGVSPLLGSHTLTRVTNPDLAVTVSSGLTHAAAGQPITYTLIVTNEGDGPAPAVTVSDTLPVQLSNASWTCTATGGGLCTARGAGSIRDDAVVLPSAGTVTYSVTANVRAGSSGSMTNTATAAVISGGIDSDAANNGASESVAFGLQRTLTLNKHAAGSVSSMPSGILCGSGCTNVTAAFVEGATVTLTAMPLAMGQFLGWGGACSGVAATCTLTISGDQSVGARFLGPAASITATAGASQQTNVGTPFPSELDVLVRDAYGEPVPNARMAFNVPGSGASARLSGSTAVTDRTGHAHVTATANATPGAYLVLAALAGAPAVFELSNLGPPSSISVVSGGTQQVRVATAASSPLVVVVRDAANQPLPGIAVEFAAPTSGATSVLSATSVISDARGQARVMATASENTGSYAISASVEGVATPAKFVFNNLSTSPRTLTIRSGSPQSSVVDKVFAETLRVQVVDSNGTPVQNVTLQFTAPRSGASAVLSDGQVITDAKGNAQITATANQSSGSYQVLARVDGAAEDVHFDLTNLAGPAVLIEADPGSTPQSARVATAYRNTLRVSVFDAFGNAVAGAPVSFGAPDGEPSVQLGTASTTTDAHGQASAVAVASQEIGLVTVTARLVGTPLMASFALENISGNPSTILLTAGGAQRVLARQAFPEPVKLAVYDAQGNPIGGGKVWVSIANGGASVLRSADELITNDDGTASLTLSANDQPGEFTLILTIAGAAAPATSTFTIAPIPTETSLALKLYGGEVKLTATVQGQHGTPTGRVQFLLDSQAAGTAELGSGNATLQLSPSAGMHEVTVVYAAQNAFAQSHSEPAVVVISDSAAEAEPSMTTDASVTDAATATGAGADAGQSEGPPKTKGWAVAGGGCSVTQPDRATASAGCWFLLLVCMYRLLRRA